MEAMNCGSMSRQKIYDNPKQSGRYVRGYATGILKLADIDVNEFPKKYY
jgi:hypothetical protein